MSSSGSTVYTGFWINWSHGRVNGSTITLSAENSAFLVAFIALFVRFVGGQLWQILTYLISVIRSTAGPQDALYHQQQAILRNTSQPTTVSWSMLKLFWFWKGTARRLKTRTLSFVFGCLAYIAAFATAGIFSSRISSTNSEVLLLPTEYCGYWHPTSSENISFQDSLIEDWSYTSYRSRLFKKAHAYVNDCYDSNITNPNNLCLPYGKSRITWTTKLDAACPFDEDICLTKAIQFDTGYISSFTHLGINTRDDHVEYRRVTTCAPIKTDGYVSGFVNVSDLSVADDYYYNYVPHDGEMWQKYAYGQSLAFIDNTTFAFSNYSSTESLAPGISPTIYKLDVEFSKALVFDVDTPAESTFRPISSLSRPDSDTSLIFLSRNGEYLSEVRDPWFSATTITTGAYNGTGPTTSFWAPDQPVSVVACAEQHQLRDPITGATGPLSGVEAASGLQAGQLGFTDNQIDTYHRSFYYSLHTVLALVIEDLGGSFLLAAMNQDLGFSAGLPDNQWQLELAHWFGVSVNTIQMWSQEYVSGPSQAELERYITPSTEGYPKEMCTNQIARRTDYRSFSVLGMGIILALGFLFILLNLTIRSIVERVQKYTVQGRYRNAEWQANEFLQLQRMVYQHNNTGTWTGQDDMVPRTSPGETFTLPESTNWNQSIPESYQREGNWPFRSLSRSWTRNTTDRRSSATGQKTSGSSLNDEPAISNIDIEKSEHIFEVRPKQ